MHFPFALLFYMSILARSRAQRSECKFPLILPADFVAKQYDYIIIGGGTAGLTVAARLSEVPDLSIGVIEAGYLHIPDVNVSTPYYTNNIIFNPEYDWMMSTVPQPSTANRSIPQPRGKLLGGSSSINNMAWTRASIPEYAAWDALNNHSGEWNWDGLLPYFLKSERRQPNPIPGLPGFMPTYYADGLLGPVDAAPNAVYSDIIPPYIDTLNHLGIPTRHEAMGGNTSGLWNTLLAIDRETGTRVDSSTAYYCPNAGRPNLRILSGATATRIVFHDEVGERGLRATGVTFMSTDGSQYTVNATQEVLLTAGVFQTPQLLELSGIGNATLLKEVGVDALLDLPGVGENLQEHAFVYSSFELNGGFTTFDNFSDPAFTTEQMNIYNHTGGGWLAATSSAFAFLPHAALLDAPSSARLLDYFDASLSQLSDVTPLARAQYEIQRSWISGGHIPEMEIIQFVQGLNEVAGRNYMSLLSGLMHPVSRGSVHINSSYPLARPRIVGNYLTADYDVQVLLELIRFSSRIAASPPLSTCIASQVAPPLDLQSDDDLINFIRQTSGVGDHVMGTAAMASKELGGVVDQALVVYGTENLRVIDASVFPLQLATHLQATVYAVAEKASDMIKLTYQSSGQ